MSRIEAESDIRVSIILISADFRSIRSGSTIVYQNRSCLKWHLFVSLADNVTPWISFRRAQLNVAASRQGSYCVSSLIPWRFNKRLPSHFVFSFNFRCFRYTGNPSDSHPLFRYHNATRTLSPPSCFSSFSKQLKLGCITSFPSGFFW